MHFDIPNPYIVAIQLQEDYDHPARLEWINERMDWIQDNVKHYYQSFFIRNAVEVTPSMIENHDCKGEWFGERWVMHFSDPCDATFFKLRWG
jgi:hypothetical protein